MKRIIRWFKRLWCRHEYERIRGVVMFDDGIAYNAWEYRKCDKFRWKMVVKK